MRASRLVVPLVTAVALVGTDVLAAASSKPAAPPKVIRLISVTTKAKDTDRPPKGASKGDRTVGASKLYNGAAQFGKALGVAVGSDKSVFVLRDKRTIHASGTATLPGGTIHFEGNAQITQGVFVIPVVSGTGDFVGARGMLLIPISTPGTKIIPNVYQLSYAAAA